MYRKWSTFVLLTLVMPLVALAQNTGKLTGRVTEAANGDGLPGAIVSIEGTTLGAASDIDGNYTILGVPVGTWNVRAEAQDFGPLLVQRVEINSGFTRTLNFAMRVSATAEEVVVVYERPLIQNDAIGTPRVTSGEQIQNLPVRGVASVAALQAGVVSDERSGTLNIQGGRGSEVTYYVDGVKVVGSLGVSQSAIAEQEMLIGSIPARYGDAMSGVISVTTRNGSDRFFGTLDAVTSQALDSYGFSSAQLSVGGPIVGSRVGFFVSGELLRNDDQNPSAVGVPQLSKDMFNSLRNAPQALRVKDASGATVYRELPASLPTGVTLKQLIDQGVIKSDDTFFNAPGSTTAFDYTPVDRYTLLKASDFSNSAALPRNELQGNNLLAKFNVSPVNAIRIVAGGQYITRAFDSYAVTRSLFNYDQNGRNEQETRRGFLTWSHYLGTKTFYQLQADVQDFQAWSFDRDFGRGMEDLLRYQDIDDASNATARGYRNAVITNRNGVVEADSVVFNQRFSDRLLPSSSGAFNLYALPGASAIGYSKSRTQQARFQGSAQTQVGMHQVEFGGEYEQRTQRAFSIGSGSLGAAAQRFADNADGSCDFDATGKECVDRRTMLAQLPSAQGSHDVLRLLVQWSPRDGQREISAPSPVSRLGRGDSTNIAPFRPIYYAGYIQDKIEYKDIVLNLGVRLDVYDSNQRILFDRYSLLPIQRAGTLGLSNGLVGDDFAVYYDGNTVAGFRDRSGKFYDTNGQVVTPNAVITNVSVKPRLLNPDKGNIVQEEAFTDYKPQAIFQPRVGVSLPVTDQALFFASYNVTAQRPSGNEFATLSNYRNRLEGSGAIGNPNLKPEKTTQYELGFRQRLGERAALQIKGFFKQIDNLIQLRAYKNVFPSNYSTYENADFGTVKGAELEFDLRRIHNVELTANYTLQFAQGTGSDANTTSNIFWLREANPYVPNFISPLDFDRRHSANIALDYRLGKNEGPMIGGMNLFENFGINVVGQFRSGKPYSRLTAPYAFDNAVRLTGLRGQVNGQNLPASMLLNLKVDRRFAIGQRTALTAYLEVENLLNADNVANVWQFTGQPDEDGYLNTAAGLQERPVGSLSRDLYQFRLRSTGNYGAPRQTRIGARLSF